jgi:CO/xanthine dehydrogenase FAD-binding subunit
MIIEYHRPESLEDAIDLLSRPTPKTVPLGGGSFLSRNSVGNVAVVDLQGLSLNYVHTSNNFLEIGACTPLQAVMESELPVQLREVLRLGVGVNTRRLSTIAGCIVTDDGRSGFLAGLLALNAQLTWQPGDYEVSLGDYLALRETWHDGKLIQEVKVPANVKLFVETVSRTPADRPILCVAVGRWSSGRTRVVLGGFGKAPILVMDGPEATGAELALRNALLDAGDAWAGAEYRLDVGVQLIRRMVKQLDEE